MSRILFVAPHPDDEILGCGGTIWKHARSGDQVHVLIATRGDKKIYSDERVKNVRQEALKAHQLLGVAETRFLDFPAPNLDTVSLAELASAIKGVITELKIDTIYLPHHGDIHHDHTAVFNAGLVASRPANGVSVHAIYAYETLSETEWAIPNGSEAFIPTRFVNIGDALEHKLDAMKCFKSQLREFPNPRSLETIESLAKYRGSTMGFHMAEAFMVIRILEE